MYVNTLIISSKGQIVLPKKIRKILGTNIISLLINDQHQIVITPVQELGGSLSSYTKDISLSFDEIREQSWKDITSPKTDHSGSEEEQ
jgi:bifunctional DNA-binding transcriptional regulator/antitoxin component of YhaV-PrlF toxin-antitoxin module